MVEDISWLTLLAAAALLLMNGIISMVLQLGLGRQLVLSSLRMVIQLTLIGWVLSTLFALVSPLWTSLVALVMLLFAAYEVRSRQKKPFSGGWGYGIGFTAMMVSASLITLTALVFFIESDPWFHPRVALPLLGMILGNTMTGISLGINTLTYTAYREYQNIEAQLAIGRSMQEAMRPVSRDAMRTAMTPIINAMAASGVVSLPGMMTGQILSGVEPAVAVKYQLLIMFLIAGATALGVLLAVVASVARLTDERQRLRLDRLQTGQPL